MKKILFTCLVFIWVFCMSAFAQNSYEQNKHTEQFHIPCTGCHAENPPTHPVKDTQCQICHGSLQEIGKKTALQDKPNPHINHNVELYCDDCHHTHRPPENYCAQCHDIKYDTP